MTLPTRLTSLFTRHCFDITFSPQVLKASPEVRRNAIAQLEEYLGRNPDIQIDPPVTAEHFIDFVDLFKEANPDLVSDQFQGAATQGWLSAEEQDALLGLGFRCKPACAPTFDINISDIFGWDIEP